MNLALLILNLLILAMLIRVGWILNRMMDVLNLSSQALAGAGQAMWGTHKAVNGQTWKILDKLRMIQEVLPENPNNPAKRVEPDDAKPKAG